MSPRLYLGTSADKGGAGLHALHHCSNSGWSAGDLDPVVQNASFGTYSARHDLYYFVDEQAEGGLGAFRETEHSRERAARVPTHGAEPCYVALNGDHSALAVANYGSGNIALFRLDDDGLPIEPPMVCQNAGSGPVEDRQDGPHAHCVCFGPDQRWFYHVDLGTDQVLAYAFDSAAGTIGERSVAYQAPPGSGPRHLVFHPVLPFALLVSELASTLTVLQADNGSLIERQIVTTLPADFGGESLGGHVSLNNAGDRIYVTNRGHDSVAVFAWHTAGTLELLQHVPSGGASPRAFVLLEAERQLVLANEESSNVTAFHICENGSLVPLDTDLKVVGAVFLLVGHNREPEGLSTRS